MPKSVGGLNVMNILLWNRAAICKQLWALAHKKDTLWVKWVHCYYLKHNYIPTQTSWVMRKFLSAKKWLQNTTDVVNTLSKFVVHDKLVIKKL